METVRMTAITFPIRFWGVSFWIKDIICTENMVENTMTAKQHRVRTIYVAMAEEDNSSAAPMGNTLTAQATLSPGYITRKSLEVTGVARYLPEYLHKSLLFLDKFQHKYPFEEFSSVTLPLEAVEEGMTLVGDKKVIHAMIQPEF